jgi:RHS repeat-associated protein
MTCSVSADALGSVTATVDQTGNVVNRYRYKPYGGLLSKSGVGADPKRQWVGSLGYRQTGKKYSDVYVRARHYDTANGRWTSKDPIGFRGADWNLYRYVASAASTFSDPIGLIVDKNDGIGGSDVKQGRYFYTCKCGWIDKGHFGAATGAGRMLQHFKNDYSRFSSVGYQFIARGEAFRIGPISAYAEQWLRMLQPPFPPITDPKWRSMAAYIAYGVLWDAEVTQSNTMIPYTQWAYDDLPSDWVGALAFLKYGGNTDKVLSDCGPVNQATALAIFDEMDRECKSGGPRCHKSMRVTTPFPNNPIGDAILFHKLYPRTNGCCPAKSDEPNMSKPPDMYKAFGIDKYIAQDPLFGFRPVYRI